MTETYDVTVAWLLDDFTPAAATMVNSDGEMVFYRVTQPEESK
jgi:hypothetical protein